MSVPSVGVQMYSVDEQAAKDYRATLARVAAMGYRGVELYGFHGCSPRELRKMSDDLGILFSSAHAAFPVGDRGRRTLDDLAELGVPTLTWSLEADEFTSRDAISRGSERVNEGAANAAAHGIEVAYHNHWAEFTNVYDGRYAYDLLWECLAENVLAEVDTYWVKVGGASPVDVVSQLGARARYLHLRDGPADDPGSPMVAVGHGTLDIPAIVAAASGARWHLVELGRTVDDVFTVLADSYNYLVGSGFSQGNRPSVTRASEA